MRVHTIRTRIGRVWKTMFTTPPLEWVEECFLLDGECLGGEAKHEADATRVVQSELYLLGPHIVVVGAGSQAASLTEICIFRLEMSMVPT